MKKKPIGKRLQKFWFKRTLAFETKPHLHTPIPTSRLESKSSEWPQQPLAEENFCSGRIGIGIGRALEL